MSRTRVPLRHRVIAVGAVALALSACSADRAGTVKASGSPQKTTTVATTTSTTTTTTTVAPSTIPTCAAPPVALVPPSLVKSGDVLNLTDVGTWDFGPDCTDQGMSIHWTRSLRYGPFEEFGGLADTWERVSCEYRYQVTVRRANEFGVTASATDLVGPFC